MPTEPNQRDAGPKTALQEVRGPLALAAALSAAVNLLMLTGPLYMLNVYDRVLGSGSIPTLVSLSVLAIMLFGFMAVFDTLRSQVLARAALTVRTRLEPLAFRVAVQTRRGQECLRPVDRLHRTLSGPVIPAVFDTVWSPLFLGAIFLLHVWLGVLALAGIATLATVAIAHRLAATSHGRRTLSADDKADRVSRGFLRDPDTVVGLSLTNAALNAWTEARLRATNATLQAADSASRFSSTARGVRLLLQSLMLGLGAYLVLMQQLSPGGIIAASVLMGRGLAPIEVLVSQWPSLFDGRAALREMDHWVSPAPATALAHRRGPLSITAASASVGPPDNTQPTLSGLNFKAEGGTAIGVLGPSGCGKSTLGRAIVGAWPLRSGSMSIAIDDSQRDGAGHSTGYLPQGAALFPGTLRDNIIGFSTSEPEQALQTAVNDAGIWDLIATLPQGLETIVDDGGGGLSGGQRQRIALARALFGRPPILVLDEPTAHLDHDGTLALNRAVKRARSRGQIVFVMSHRPAAITECDTVLFIKDGVQCAFGARADVLPRILETRGSDRLDLVG